MSRRERLAFLLVIPSTDFHRKDSPRKTAILTWSCKGYWRTYAGRSWRRFRIDLFLIRDHSSVCCYLRPEGRPDSTCDWRCRPSIVGHGGRLACFRKQTEVARLQEIQRKISLRSTTFWPFLHLIAVAGGVLRQRGQYSTAED